MDQATLKDVCARFNKLYSGAIADMLDKRGFRNQVLPYFITPMTDVRRVCGVAFTGQGYPCANTSDDDTEKRLAMLDSITPYTISVWACGGHSEGAWEPYWTVGCAILISLMPCSSPYLPVLDAQAVQ